jgi:hypothetical protein
MQSVRGEGAPFSRRIRWIALSSLVALAPACGASPSRAGAETDAGGGSSNGGGGSGSGGTTLDGGAPGSGGGSGGGSVTNGSEGGAALSGDGATPGPSSAAALAAKLGKPSRLLIGLGSSDSTAIQSQGLTPDLYEEYLVGAGGSDWTTWNSPAGSYVNDVAATADTLGALPMFTLYQMATNGDGNISDITDATFMTTYWANVVLLFQRLALYGKPALVNFEPDFWGYTEQASPGGDPTKLAASVSIAADCASLPDTVNGLARCLLQIARKYAPKAYVGFSPSEWGSPTLSDVVAYMQAVGAGGADFVVMQTLDRDAGCFEAATQADCMRQGTGWYWDETNTTHPNFQDHLAVASAFNTGLNLPLVWWQTPLGVPSTTAGGTVNHYRDNRVHYFLTHPAELVAVGGLGVVFGAGSSDCTEITTDSGQWKTLSTAYFASPAALP